MELLKADILTAVLPELIQFTEVLISVASSFYVLGGSIPKFV